MNKLRCKIFLESNAEHCQQIYTGISDLASQGDLDLEVEVSPNFSSNICGIPLVSCIFDESINIVFDLSDGKKIINKSFLNDADVYYKRSYDKAYHSTIEHGNKIYPLGLNYLVYSKASFWKERFFATKSVKEKLKILFRYNKFISKQLNIQDSLYACETRNFEAIPYISSNPKVLFLARAWKPENVETEDKKLQRKKMNDQRAEIIRTLRDALGDSFIGGFLKEPYAEEMYSDCTVEKNITNKNNYLEIMKSCDICIATKGLDDSIGWKFSEYVSSSKAIVTEPLMFEVPGDFKEGQNYLSFSTSSECVHQVEKLLKNKLMRLDMMQNNYKYYYTNVEPKMLVLNTLLNALKISYKKQKERKNEKH